MHQLKTILSVGVEKIACSILSMLFQSLLPPMLVELFLKYRFIDHFICLIAEKMENKKLLKPWNYSTLYKIIQLHLHDTTKF